MIYQNVESMRNKTLTMQKATLQILIIQELFVFVLSLDAAVSRCRDKNK